MARLQEMLTVPPSTCQLQRKIARRCAGERRKPACMPEVRPASGT